MTAIASPTSLGPCQTDSLRVLIMVPRFEQAEAIDARLKRVPAQILVLNRGGLGGRTALRRLDPDVVLCHLDMIGDGSGSLVRALERHDSNSPVVVLYPPGREAEAVRAVNQGAVSCLPLLPSEERLTSVLARAIQCRTVLLAERQRARLELDRAEALALDSERFDDGLDRLYMVWQPITGARQGELFGYEALVRSDSPETPSAWHLLELASRLGRSSDLHRAVLQAVVQDIQTGGLQGSCFVNVALDDFVHGVHGTPEDPLLPYAERVVLEVNEEGHLADIAEVQAVTARVRAAGYRVAMDDLGAGSDSLARMLALDPDLYKIDRLAVTHCDDDPRKRRYIRSVVNACRRDGGLVVAEGIERPEEAQTVRELGCDLLQGYLLGRPQRRTHWLEHPLDLPAPVH